MGSAGAGWIGTGTEEQKHRGPTAAPTVPGAVGQAVQGAQQGKPWAEAALEMQPRD